MKTFGLEKKKILQHLIQQSIMKLYFCHVFILLKGHQNSENCYLCLPSYSFNMVKSEADISIQQNVN